MADQTATPIKRQRRSQQFEGVIISGYMSLPPEKEAAFFWAWGELYRLIKRQMEEAIEKADCSQTS